MINLVTTRTIGKLQKKTIMEYSTVFKILLIFQAISLIVGQRMSPEEIMKKNLQIVQDRCNKNAPVAVPIDRIAEYLQNVSVASAKITQDSIDQHDPKYVCKNRKAITVPVKNFFNFVQQCLPKDEAYFKDFMASVLDEFLDFLCRNGGANIDIFSGPQFQQCATILGQTESVKKEFESCVDDLFDTFSTVIPKSTFCKQLNILRSCFGGVVKRHCSQFNDIQILREEFFDALTKPCSSCTFTVSLFLLLLAIISTKIF